MAKRGTRSKRHPVGPPTAEDPRIQRGADAIGAAVQAACTTEAGWNRTDRAVAWDIFDAISAETSTISQDDATVYVDALTPILDPYRCAMLDIACQGATGEAPIDKVTACIGELAERLAERIGNTITTVTRQLAEATS